VAQAIQADGIRRFVDSVLELKHRFDKFEQEQIADALADLPDPDNPGNPRDDLDPSPLPAPHYDNQLSEVVLGRERDDQVQEVERLLPPGEFAAPSPPDDPVSGKVQSVSPAPAISLNADSAVTHDDGHICGRDRRAARKRQRLLSRGATPCQ
jgi:hypothetical protein